MLRVLTRSLVVASRSTAERPPSIAIDRHQPSIATDRYQPSITRRQLHGIGSLIVPLSWPSMLVTPSYRTRILGPSDLRALFCSQTRPSAASDTGSSGKRRPPIGVYQTWKDTQKQKDTFGLLAALKAADAQVIQDAHTYSPAEACSILAHRIVYIHPAPSQDFIDAIESQIMAQLDELGCADIAVLLKIYGTCEHSLPLDFEEVFPSLEQNAEKKIRGFTALDIQNTLEGLNALSKYAPSVSLLQALIKHADLLLEYVEKLEKQK